MAAHNEKIGQAQERASKVNEINISIEVNASEEGKLFGSVGTRDIADAVNAKVGSDISKAEVLMPHGVIRDLGDYEIALDLGYDVQANVSVAVVGLQSAASVTDDGSIIEEIEEAEAVEAAEAAVEESAEVQGEEAAAEEAEEEKPPE